MNAHDSILFDTLSLNTGASLGDMRVAFERAVAAGARPFEAVAGAPHRRYGARVTLVPKPGGRAELAAALALDHPWGPPSCVGLRSVDDRLAVKQYHSITRIPECVTLPSSLQDDLVPQLATLEGDRIEVYLRSARDRSWRSFVIQALAPLCSRARATAIVEAARPLPRPAARHHGVSYRFIGGRLDAISVFADGRALPDQRRVRAEWLAGLSPADGLPYERLLGAVCNYGRIRSGATNAMLGWSIDHAGAEQRAVSLAIPVA